MSAIYPNANFGRKPHQAELDLWSGSIPSDNDPSFQLLIKSPRPANRLFEPKDQHCGVWKDAPNKECHASFGDRGTTATVSCYGNLSQISQFLGAGHSGLFSMDHISTDEPYFVVDRAEFLNSLSSKFSRGNESFGLRLSPRYWPDQPLEVKWVNWRWPRYEWSVLDKHISASISSQWFVKNNICFQQLVVTNTGKKPIYDFMIWAQHDMFIRDLDYLDDPSYNDTGDETYTRGQGPNGFSWITANSIDHVEEPVSGKENNPRVNPLADTSNFNNEGQGLETPEVHGEESQKEQPTSPPKAERPRPRTPSSQANVELDSPSSDSHSSSREDKAGNNYHQIDIEGSQTAEQSPGAVPNDERCRPSDDELWQQRRIEDTWSSKSAHAVVSVMSLFVDGNAEKIDGNWPRPARRTIEASGGDSNVVEIVVAYKMIAIPKEKAHWENFLIPAEMANVSSMLAAETKELWGHGANDDCNCSLFDSGIFMKDLKEQVGKNTDDFKGQPTTISGFESHKLNVESNTGLESQHGMTTSPDLARGAGTEEVLTAAGLSEKQRATQNTVSRLITDTHPGGPGTRPQEFSSMDSIEYLTWRQTEHILSVCTIPLSTPCLSHGEEVSGPIDWEEGIFTSKIDAVFSSKGEETEPGVPLALTCGDMSGHRICTSASFFAFEFLTNVLRRLLSAKQTPYINSLQRRIDAACRGHIRWLEWLRKPWKMLEGTESLLGSGCFAANYWVSGQIMPEGSASWQPDNTTTDTAYQILKMTAYVKWFQKAHNIQSLKDERLKVYMALLRDVWAYWVCELHDLDKRKAYAWRHASKDGLNTFRLDDHVWLWKSLVELHYLELWDLTEASSKTSRNSRWVCLIRSLTPEPSADEANNQTANPKRGNKQELFPDFALISRRISPKEVQKAVLQRFTVENDVSQERMLAVTRSARDTRFFFHTRDTTLFYGHRKGFFLPETPFGELWKRTIRSQSHHEESKREEWQSPLRFALGAVAGLNGFSIDNRSPSELVRHSLKALIEASAHSAFVPGEIDPTTRQPSIFSEERDRDYYYHVGFETCHILLKYAREFGLALRSAEVGHHSPATKQSKIDSQEVQSEMKDLLNDILVQLKKQNSVNYPQGHEYRALSKPFGTDGRGDKRPAPTAMKKSIPFNNMIDVSSINNLEEEWLYNYPDFLLGKKVDLHHQLKLLFDETKKQYNTVYDSPSSVIDKALKTLKRAPQEEFPFSEVAVGYEGSEPDDESLVASLPKQKNQRQRRGKRIGTSLDFPPCVRLNKALWDSIGKARSSDTAKKRFLWLSARSDTQTALLCWLATPDIERPAISLFFDRHAGYDNHVWDDTTMVLNTWQTELHMCFWVIRDKNQPVHEGLPFPMVAPWPRGNDKEFRRASIGFRFDGDFFDRYWTCHFIQYVPGLSQESSRVPFSWWSGFRKDKHWWQRKVLELQLVQFMLNLMLTNSKKILEDIEKELGLRQEKLIFSVLNTEAYSTSAGHWQIYEELLGKAEEDISSSLNTLSKWVTREEDRGQERPRWTRNDERKYRGYINKLRNQTERQRWDLESSRDKIRKLKETLATRQTKIQSDLEAGREQNIRYFTYVTVIFLPLGFASSFYSMNGAPSSDLIASLAKFSAAAFAVTAVFLISVGTFTALAAKALAAMKHVILMIEEKSRSVIQRTILLPLQRYSRVTRERSLLFKGIPASSVSSSAKALHKVYPKKDWMASQWFWPAYLFLELPTRTVSSAWTAVRIGTLSFSAVWTVFLGIIVLPVYGVSRVVLFSFTNIVLLLRITGHLYRLSRKERAKDGKKRVLESKAPDEQVQETQMGDSEKNPAGQSVLPDHFQKLMPTAEPLNSLQTLEWRLKQRLENVEAKENATVQKESPGT